jgi:hypothetical protein
VTVKTTRAARGRTKISVVVRRFLGPLVPIHLREELKCLTLDGRDRLPLARDDLGVLEDPDVLDELPGEVEAAEPPPRTAPPSEGTWMVVEGALVLAGAGAGGAGSGSLGIVGSGTVVMETVTEGTVGTGT